ncbi:Rv1733c family protein [Streptomyces iconiensis]|uniref:Uncharacterized protein n=1 Tax=Streptomyces iconiensis TaxID=1384038 RepID=A0ABT7A2F2_9ACTN|nr:hypothetical protein [Streptomyces iconiensis]MDJ1135486.1 hypothetical protein [Streptomyces iconiensis]
MRDVGWRWRWQRVPMRRPWDVADAWVGLLTLLALLLVVPAAGNAAGRAVAERGMSARAAQMTERHEAVAVLLRDAPRAGADAGAARGKLSEDEALVRARWSGPDGLSRVGDVVAVLGQHKGDRVRIWVHEDGQLAEVPLSRARVTGDAILAGLVAASLAALLLVALRRMCRRCLDRARLCAWDREWAEVGPQWGEYS